MKRGQTLLAIAVVVLLSATACHRVESRVSETESVAPATPPPGNPDETDTALTQTVEIGEERSPNEGGVLTNPEQTTTATVAPATATTATTTTTSTTP